MSEEKTTAPSQRFMRTRVREHRRQAVLCLGRERAEWVHWDADGNPMYAACDVAGADARDLVRAAGEAHRAAGSPRRRFVLALDHGLHQHRILVLPPLPKREIDEVLRRKAANLLGCELDDALFSALKFPAPMDSPAAGESAKSQDSPESRWLLLAMRRSQIVPLLHRLHESGLRPERTVSSGLSILCAIQRERADRSRACIAVSVEKSSINIGLIDGDALIQHDVLTGSFAATPSLALALLQEIKSCDAFWRKRHRGGSVGEVVLAGVPRERADVFAAAVRAAIPRADVTHFRADGDASAESAGRERAAPAESAAPAAPAATLERAERLWACARTGEFQVDLTLRLPVPARSAALWSAVALLIAGALGAVTYRGVEQRRERLQSEARRFAAQAADLSEIRARRAHAESELENLEARAERYREIRASGIRLSSETDAIFTCFGGDARVQALTLGREAEGGEVEIRGVTDPHPWRAVQNVKRIARALGESGLFSDIIALPAEPSSSESGSGPDRATAFTIQAHSIAAPSGADPR